MIVWLIADFWFSFNFLQIFEDLPSIKLWESRLFLVWLKADCRILFIFFENSFSWYRLVKTKPFNFYIINKVLTLNFRLNIVFSAFHKLTKGFLSSVQINLGTYRPINFLSKTEQRKKYLKFLFSLKIQRQFFSVLKHLKVPY